MLQSTDFSDANMTGVKCHRCKFILTDVRHADFTGADLREATFESVIDDQTNVCGAKLPDYPAL